MVGGGAEKVTLQLLTDLDRALYIPMLVLFEKKGDFLGALPDDVELHDLKKQTKLDFLRLIFSLVSIVKNVNPDIVCSSLMYANIVTVLASLFVKQKTKFVVTEHSVPERSLNSQGFSTLKKIIYRVFMPLPSKVIADGL